MQLSMCAPIEMHASKMNQNMNESTNVPECPSVSKITKCYKRIGYNSNVMQQSACLVINPITVDNFAALFNCTPGDRASDTMMAKA